MGESSRPPRLVSLHSTDPVPFISRPRPLPPLPESVCGVSAEERERRLEHFASAGEVVKHLADLISEADVSYLDVPGGEQAKVKECPKGKLVQALVNQDSSAFSFKGDYEAQNPPQTTLLSPTTTPRRRQFQKRAREEEDSATPQKAPRKFHKEVRTKLCREGREQFAGKLVEVIEAVITLWDQDENECSITDDERKLKALRALSAETERVAASGALHLVPAEQIRKLLGILRQPIQKGNVHAQRKDNVPTALLTGLESAVLVMRFIAAPNMPSQIRIEEVIEAVINCTKFHLESNIYTLLSPMHFELQRQRGSGNICEAGLLLVAYPIFLQAPKIALDILSRVEILLQLIVDLIGIATIDIGYLIPLLRVALEGVYIESNQLLMCQLKAQGLVIAAFSQSSLRGRKDVFDEVLELFIRNDIDPKNVVRQRLADGAGDKYIQSVSSIIIQIIQISIELPELDVSEKEVGKCFSHPAYWADEFWTFVFKRLSKSKGQKSEGQADLKANVENFLADLMNVVNLPQWPGASFLLLRFSKSNAAGLRNSDNGVKILCIDFMGRVAAWLCANHLLAEQDIKWAQQVASLQAECLDERDLGNFSSPLRSLRFVLLDHLAARNGSLDNMTLAACRFQVSSMFVEAVRELVTPVDGQPQKVDSKKIANLRVEHRALYDRMVSSWNASSSLIPAEKLDLKPEDVVRVGRAVCAQSPHGFAQLRSNFILGLSESGDRTKNESNQAQVRSRAVKALGSAVEVDSRILGWQIVKSGVQVALQDDSIAVREAAVDLFGHFLGSNQHLSLQYFDLLVKATHDPGLSVRRRSLKLLWDCCIRPTDFPRFADACAHLLAHSNDKDIQIQNIVQRACNDLWFLDASGHGSDTSSHEIMRSRAKSLSQVAESAFEDGICEIAPLRLTDPLVTVLKKALADGGSSHFEAGRQLACAVMDAVILLEEGQTSCASGTFPYFLALNALAMADTALLIPEEDNAQFIRFLHPYISQSPPKSEDSIDSALFMNQTLCILGTISTLAQSVPNLELEAVKGLCTGIYEQMKHTCRWEVISLACSALCQIASRDERMGKSLQSLAQKFLSQLRAFMNTPDDMKSMKDGSAEHGRCRWYMFVVGRLCRYGADLLESDGFHLSECLEMFLKALEVSEIGSIRETALESVGNVCISKPEMMPKADTAIATALNPSSSLALTKMALKTLTELLKSEEDRMLLRQKENAAEQEEKVIIGQGSAPNRIPLVNGQGDGTGYSSALLQRLWDSVCSVATDVQHGNGTSGPLSSASAIRLSATELMETVLRGGLVAPWKAVPPLIALATGTRKAQASYYALPCSMAFLSNLPFVKNEWVPSDPHKATSDKALRLLSQEAKIHPGFFGQQVPQGLIQAYQFQCGLSPHVSLEKANYGASKVALRGLSQIYRTNIMPIKDVRNRFLDGVLFHFKTAANISSGGARKSDTNLLGFLAYVAAELPYTKGDEICTLLYSINGIVARRGDANLIWLKEIIEGKASTVPSPSGHGSELSTPVQREPGLLPSPESCAPTPHRQLDATSQACDIVKAALSVSILILLKDYLKEAYNISDDRIAMFNPVGERRKLEEKLSVTRRNINSFTLKTLRVRASGELSELRYQFTSFMALMHGNSAAEYGVHLGQESGPGASVGTSGNRTPRRKPRGKKLPKGSTTPTSRKQKLSQ